MGEEITVTATPVPPPPARPPFAVGFLEGLRTPVAGLRFLLRHPRLWHYAILPILINMVITLLLLVGLGYAAYQFLLYMHTWPAFAGWWGRLQEFFWALVVIAITLSLIAGSYLLVGGILIGWFNERLARKVELAIGTPPGDLVELPFKYQVIDGITDFTKVALTAIGCFLLGCIPVIGFIVGGAISFYIDCFIFGVDYLDYPLALRGMRRSDKRAFARRHRPQVLGLGATVLLMNFIPLIGAVFLTTAAAGAVLLHKRLKDGEIAEIP